MEHSSSEVQSMKEEESLVCLFFHKMQKAKVRVGSWCAGNRRAATETLDKYAGVWGVASILFSAFFYLFDFATNMKTLRTYYYFQIGCTYPSNEHAKECQIIAGVPFRSVFVACLSIMVVAHGTNSLIFWLTLSASEHPLRCAYFLPFIHLSRLLKLLWRACSLKSLEEYAKSQEELNSILNILVASLETVPQIILQFHIAMHLGWISTETINIDPSSYDYYAHLDKASIDASLNLLLKDLFISIMASLMSGIYSASMAVLFLIQKRGMPSFLWRTFIFIVAGVHTLGAMGAKVIISAALSEAIHIHLRYASLMAYICVGVIITWVFFEFLLKKSPHDDNTNQINQQWAHRLLHSLALAYVSFFIGPMYVIVKFFDDPRIFLVWGTLLHIFVELLGLIVVLVDGRHLPLAGWFIPCNAMHQGYPFIRFNNVYLSCCIFLGVLCPSVFLLLLSSVLFHVVYKRGIKHGLSSQIRNQRLALNEAHV